MKSSIKSQPLLWFAILLADLLFHHRNVGAPSRALLCDFDNGCTYALRQTSDPLPSRSTVDETGGGEQDDDIKHATAELKNRTVSFIFYDHLN
jgi:hypothetical protein